MPKSGTTTVTIEPAPKVEKTYLSPDQLQSLADQINKLSEQQAELIRQFVHGCPENKWAMDKFQPPMPAQLWRMTALEQRMAEAVVVKGVKFEPTIDHFFIETGHLM